MTDLRSDPPPAGDRKGRGQEGYRAHAVLRSGAGRQQDAGEGRGGEAVQGEGGGSPHREFRRQAAPPRPVRRLSSGLEEGLREAEGRARRCPSSRRSKRIMPIKTYRPDNADRGASRRWSRARTSPSRRPEKSLVRVEAAHRRPQQHRPRHVAVHRRRPQEGLPGGRFQARQDGHSGGGGGHRVRSQPLGAHRAAELRGWREALHPPARRPEGRAEGDVRSGRRHPARQRAAAEEHAGRHGGSQHRAAARQGRADGALGGLAGAVGFARKAAWRC